MSLFWRKIKVQVLKIVFSLKEKKISRNFSSEFLNVKCIFIRWKANPSINRSLTVSDWLTLSYDRRDKEETFLCSNKYPRQTNKQSKIQEDLKKSLKKLIKKLFFQCFFHLFFTLYHIFNRHFIFSKFIKKKNRNTVSSALFWYVTSLKVDS